MDVLATHEEGREGEVVTDLEVLLSERMRKLERTNAMLFDRVQELEAWRSAQALPALEALMRVLATEHTPPGQWSDAVELGRDALKAGRQ